MKKTLSLDYSHSNTSIATRNYWWWQVGWPYASGLIPVALILIYHSTYGEVTWITWLFGIGFITYSSIVFYLYFYYMNYPQSQSLNASNVTLDLEEDYFRISSDIMEEKISWNSVRDFWYMGNFWLIAYSRHKFLVLPVERLCPDIKSFILSMIEKSGTNCIIDKRDSLIFRTGQGWKIRIMRICFYFGCLFVFIPWILGPVPYQWIEYSNFAGGGILVFGLIILASVRCPKCGSCLYTQAFKILPNGGWSKFVLAMKKCPRCANSEHKQT